jgi:hypothetical protein
MDDGSLRGRVDDGLRFRGAKVVPGEAGGIMEHVMNLRSHDDEVSRISKLN